MGLSSQQNIPARTGIKIKDENKLHLSKVASVVLKPIAQKVIDNFLWYELSFIISLIITGIGEVKGVYFSNMWYAIFTTLAIIVGFRSLLIMVTKYKNELSRSNTDK